MVRINKTFLLLFLFLIKNLAFADTVYLKNGGFVRGKIIEETVKKIKIEYYNIQGYTEVDKDAIQSVEKEIEKAQESTPQLQNQALELKVQQKESITAPSVSSSLENINSTKEFEDSQEYKVKSIGQKTKPAIRNTQKLWFIGILSIVFVFFLVLSPKMIYLFKIYNRARSDYLQARGTYHLRQIKISLRRLKEKINILKIEEDELIAKIKNLKEERSRKLLEALSSFLVQGQFIDIRGVGPTLRQRIISHCFDGTIQSLKRANAVRGIGGEKYYAVCQWVSAVESKLPDLLKDDFPNKNSIIEEYNQQGLQINAKLRNIKKEISELISLREASLKAKANLEKVKITSFIKSYRLSEEDSMNVNEYLQGIFPEWGKIPQWYKILISQYGG